MAKGFAVVAGFAMLAACGVTDLYPPVGNGVGPGGSVGGRTGSSGGNTNGNPVGGNTGTVGGVGTVGGNTVGNTNGRNPGSSTGRMNTAVGGTTSGGNTGSGGGVGGSTGRGSSAGSGIGGTGSNGTGGNGPGGTGGNTTGGGGCIGLFSGCDPSVGCGCGNDCVFDAVLDQDVCEATCKNHPCTDPKTLCDGTNCVLIPCGPPVSNGSYDGACSADGNSNDQNGTCVPIPTDAGGAFCELAGTSDGGCDPDATRSQPANLCAQGDYCERDFRGVDYVCYTLCDPNNGGTALCQADGFTFCLGPGPLGACF